MLTLRIEKYPSNSCSSLSNHSQQNEYKQEGCLHLIDCEKIDIDQHGSSIKTVSSDIFNFYEENGERSSDEISSKPDDLLL